MLCALVRAKINTGSTDQDIRTGTASNHYLRILILNGSCALDVSGYGMACGGRSQVSQARRRGHFRTATTVSDNND